MWGRNSRDYDGAVSRLHAVFLAGWKTSLLRLHPLCVAAGGHGHAVGHLRGGRRRRRVDEPRAEHGERHGRGAARRLARRPDPRVRADRQLPRHVASGLRARGRSGPQLPRDAEGTERLRAALDAGRAASRLHGLLQGRSRLVRVRARPAHGRDAAHLRRTQPGRASVWQVAPVRRRNEPPRAPVWRGRSAGSRRDGGSPYGGGDRADRLACGETCLPSDGADGQTVRVRDDAHVLRAGEGEVQGGGGAALPALRDGRVRGCAARL